MITKSLFEFIKSSPDPYLASQAVCDRLADAGYTEMQEYDTVGAGKHYIRRGNAVVAFRSGGNKEGFMITASHLDSPSLRLKSSADKASAGYKVLTTERYGGMINYTWFDRPLMLSGRAMVRTTDGIKAKLFRSDAPAAMIPSVAPHLNRKANTEFVPDVARDLVPLFGDGDDYAVKYIASLCGVPEEDVISFDGVLTPADEPRVFGAEGQFMASPRLDDLMCVCTMLEGFLGADESSAVPVFCAFDGEEIGSRLRDGAAADLLPVVLRMIAGDEQVYRRMLKNTVMISADNAHAVHPNRAELSDSADVRLNGGVVVKRSASHSYMTEADSDAVVCELCRIAGVPVQHFSNRSDLPGGSTLGAIAVTGLPVICADIGAPQLAMHSAVETAGVRDVEYMTRFAKEFYSSSVSVNAEGITIKRGI